eukprot:m.442752 g.442752  ORF g.442752 m.442752 type:complete len:454 (+) comp18850_c0_seq1:64-1425(+)
MSADGVPRHSVEVLTFRSVKRARDIFLTPTGPAVDPHEPGRAAKVACKRRSEYSAVMDLPVYGKKSDVAEGSSGASKPLAIAGPGPAKSKLVQGGAAAAPSSTALALVKQAAADRALAVKAPTMPKPKFHPQWKLMRVIAGHLGWVRCVTVDPSNQWFVTGSADRTIKIWDLASGTLKLTLTGHISTVRGVAVSPRHPYLFSVGEDKQVKNWDLETNKVIRHYHGHLSAVHTVAIHPTLDVLMTGGRDATVRVWDMRTKSQVHCLGGHTNTVASILTRKTDPQVISGSHDSTIRLWDLAAGRSMCTLTNHKKSVRALVAHPNENTFTSASPDNIKQWYLPEAKFIQNLTGHSAVVNAMACNSDGVLVSGADNGSLSFWDHRTGYRFQQQETIVQPGSLDSEAGIFAMTFDRSGSRLITTEADKTIKVWKEDPESTEMTHPVNWKPHMIKKARF